jgi:hypothetical protein
MTALRKNHRLMAGEPPPPVSHPKTSLPNKAFKNKALNNRYWILIL